MTIYTRFGEAVQLTEARLIPMWFVKRPHEVASQYTKPKKLPKGAALEEFPSWHYKGTGDGGRPICDGKWVEVISLKADDGWNEIMQKMIELNPTDAAKYNEWNKAGSPEASHFFPAIKEQEGSRA